MKRDQVARQIGRKIRLARELREWSQVELGKRLRLQHSFVCQLEQGTRLPSVMVLARVGRVLQIHFRIP